MGEYYQFQCVWSFCVSKKAFTLQYSYHMPLLGKIPVRTGEKQRLVLSVEV